MPINVYTGLMRSGKSYEVVSQVILPAILKGRDVVTNVDGISEELIHEHLAKENPNADRAKFGRVRHVTNEDVFKPDFLPFYDDAKTAHTDTVVQPGDLVAIDEAWRFWGTDCKLLKQHKSFFLEHGHFTHPETGVACDLVLMIQDMGTLHRFLKNVVAFSARTHKKVSFGLNNTYSVVMFEGYKMNKATRIGDWVRRYDKRIFPLYSSFKGGAQGKTVTVDARQNIFANRKLWFVVVLCVVGGAWGFRNVWNFFHPVDPKAATQKVQEGPKTAQGGPNAPAPGSAPSPIGVPSFSKDWRVVGHVMQDGEAWVLLADNSGRIRMESPSVVVGSGLRAVGVIDGERVTSYTGTVAVQTKEGK